MTTPFLMQSSAGDKPFPVSAVRFHIGAGDMPRAGGKEEEIERPARSQTPQRCSQRRI